MQLVAAKRVENLPPYLFAQIDKLIEEKKSEGVDIISLGIGDPVEPTPREVIETMKEALKNPENHRYPSYYGLKEFRDVAIEWLKNRFNIELNPETQVLPVIGSKEGIAHIPWALVDPGDIVLVPDPSYPVYKTSTMLAGGKPYLLPLREENDFLADFESLSSAIAGKTKLMFLNYPNNPTSATADITYFKRAVKWARRNNVIVAHDNAYCDISYHGFIPSAILQVKGAEEVAVEFYSLSKSFNMTGWRIGFIAGNSKVIDALGRLKTNIDSGIFNPIQYAGIKALKDLSSFPVKMSEIYRKRRDKVVQMLDKVGLDYHRSDATIYVWVKTPPEETSESFTKKILDKTGVVVSPGNAYGENGEGYIRISLTVNDRRLEEAVARLERAIV